MVSKKRIICVIPARLQATRFPKKLLAQLSGKPLIQWAWEGACSIPFFADVVVAADSEEIAAVVRGFGGKVLMTSVDCPNGTARLVELQRKGAIAGDIWVNWQGDEPFLSVQSLTDLLQSCESSAADMWTLRKRILEEAKIRDPNICKIVCDANGYALYFSRSPIPYVREADESLEYFQHIGLYAYTAAALEKISTMNPCFLERVESLEQLRFLFHGLKIQVHETKADALGIDIPEHLVLAEQYLQDEEKKKRLFNERCATISSRVSSNF